MASLLKSEPKYLFLEKRKAAAITSVVVILIGLGIFASHGEKMFGVDFTTGTSMRVAIESSETIDVDAVRETLEKGGFASAIVQEAGDGTDTQQNRFLIRIADEAGTNTNVDPETTQGDVTSAVQAALATLSDAAEGEKVEVMQSETVGPAVGAQLRSDAQWSIAFALFFIVLYLWFRFEWKYATGAVVALMHDVLVVIGILALFQREISIPTVAALLTIIGYSLNDTIVVFDRVREDIALNKSRGMNFIAMLNVSLNRTLGRTLLTSLTTLFVVVVLFLFGGPAINDFALALIAGVLVGTYSSLFVATPVVYALQKWSDKREDDKLSKSSVKKPKLA